MREFLERLFIGHKHKWDMKEVISVMDGNVCVGKIVVMQCSECGKLKNHKIKW